MKSYETLTEALKDLSNRGYVYNFNIESGSIVCKDISLRLDPQDFEISEFYRFEGNSSAGDEEVVYAITSKDGIKGTLVDAYGAYADELSGELLAKLKIDR